MEPIINVSSPTNPPAEKKLTKDLVWGVCDLDWKRNNLKGPWVSQGLIVARSGDICPIFKGRVPIKSVTAVCTKEQEQEVIYWLEYVHGAESVSKRKVLEDGKIALRSDYKCW